ncbi:hypothetical protein Golob_022261 [Gossypium lobatum]|uniref:Uncharacterized protein n=1 Tax=Gossypium lobatum TaxID=34289 RepID=A0A7J8LG27_9ROSI|nr:hypothetical protein [Gossypium lobatum]
MSIAKTTMCFYYQAICHMPIHTKNYGIHSVAWWSNMPTDALGWRRKVTTRLSSSLGFVVTLLKPITLVG